MGTNKRRRHRAWPESLKREIVAATLQPGSSASRVARRYDVNANQVFAWRRHYRDGAAESAELRLLPVTVTPDPPRGTAPAGSISRSRQTAFTNWCAPTRPHSAWHRQLVQLRSKRY